MAECSDGAELLRDLEKVAGRAAVDRFIEVVGGTRVYIPRGAPTEDSNRIVEALGGLESAPAILEKLAPLYGGMSVSIPLYGSSLTAKRSEGIKEALLKGEESIMRIAARFHVTERTVHYWKTRLQDAELLPMPAHRQPSGAEPQAGQNIELDLLTCPGPDTRSNREIARLYKVTERHVAAIRSRLIRQGRIPSRMSEERRG